ncbi:hypothetical protein EYZ11_006170 [Aspergillus tanneri]|uniref:Beta-lactamase-related domain-containing protein n=1 Tax=Aspergillus tanneri TaxID=1220188 RepID=A0A4S3JGI1_9EURO|nr:hypothetical protein EYZ11_006170 [Aspergillus tanneri]
MDATLLSRLMETTPIIEEVRQNQLPAMSDTQYLIGSVSKSFLSAAVGILVDQGKLQWLDPIQKYIPEFDPIGDPNIGQKADLIDALRHSTGLGVPNLLCLGPRSTLLNDEKDYIKLLNSMPTANHEGHRFNSWWMYNNYAYSLIAKVVEVASGQKTISPTLMYLPKPGNMLGFNRYHVRNMRHCWLEWECVAV